MSDRSLPDDLRVQIREVVFKAVRDALAEAHIHDPDEHAKQHDAIRAIIEEEQWRTRMYRRIYENVLGWGVMGGVTIIGAALIEYFKSRLSG